MSDILDLAKALPQLLLISDDFDQAIADYFTAHPIPGYTDEQARDAIGAALSGLNGLGFEIDDAANTIKVKVIDPAALRTALALVVGTNVQAASASLDALAGLSGNNRVVYRNGSGQFVTRGLGTGLTDDGTDIKTTGGTVNQSFELYYSDANQRTRGYYRAPAAQTVTVEARGGTIQYAKSTTAAPAAFGSTVNIDDGATDTVTLEAGAYLRLNFGAGPNSTWANVRSA